MLKKLTMLAVAASTLFFSCKKDDPANEFVINGVHDVTIGGGAGSNVLALTVQQSSGSQEPVTIKVTDLPAGISADIQPASGTPSFAAAITFIQSGNATAGTYPIHIVGTSASYTKTYDLNLSIPALNGFVFDGIRFNRSSVNHSTQVFGPYTVSTILVSSTDNTGGFIGGYTSASIGEAWPSTDGTYTYKVGGYSNNSMSVSFYSNTSGGSVTYDNNVDDSTKQATVVISGGKFKLTMSDIPLSNSSGSVTKKITVNASE